MKESSILTIKIPPPIVTLIFSGLMYLLSAVNDFQVAGFNKAWLIIILLVIAIFLLFPAVVQFYRSKTTVNPLKPETSSVLVKTGIYYYSRNPMYLGMAFFLLAWLVFLGNPFNIIIFIGFILFMNRFQIKFEEQALEKLFGDDFRQYIQKVRRWI
ncbi:MAG: protein-S-isoprenylcysteine O-methyltransferase Ste14 [Oleiphilaceae bacterium]|jgi:protein-S-isoprenylcysteine O-methyltransferase Ste14